jgi:hypothetical protein
MRIADALGADVNLPERMVHPAALLASEEWRAAAGGRAFEWRAYEEGAIAYQQLGSGELTAYRSELVGWRSRGHPTPADALDACREHGPGRYLIGLFTMRPFGAGWTARLGAIFIVTAESLNADDNRLLR